jgi:hypothetical protein
MKHQPSIIKAADWDEYKKFTGSLSDNWVFRGQLNADWEIRNALERSEFIKHHKGIEKVFLKEFQRGSRNYLQRDEMPCHVIEWLALMQHHGAPTRLVDFSRSPFISAYFAFEQCWEDAESVAIWAININYIRRAAFSIIRERLGNDFASDSKDLVNEEVFEKIFELDELSLIFPVEPFRMNRRYSLQQSLFVSTGNSSETFMEQTKFLGEMISSCMVRIEIPTNNKKQVIRDLLKMNIHRASLFPDLDGYAVALKMKYDNMRSAEEAMELQVKLLNDPGFHLIP